MDQQIVMDAMVKEYAEIEKQAARILEDRQQIVDLDHRKNKTREALRQLRTTHTDKAWMCLGNTFLKVDSDACIKMMIKDHGTIDAEMIKLSDGLKPKVKKLHVMEGAAEVKGFDLKGMNMEEMLNITNS